MNEPFDVFRKDRNGALVWRAAANSLHEARATVERFRKIESSETEFVIFNQQTQEQTTVKLV